MSPKTVGRHHRRHPRHRRDAAGGRAVAGARPALPALVDGAFVIIAWVGIKLSVEYLHDAHYTDAEIPRWLSLGLIVVIFLIAFVYARLQGPVEQVDPLTEKAEAMLDTHSR